MASEKMTGEKLAALIAREKASVERNMAKRAEYDEKVRKGQARLHELEMMQNSNKFDALSAVAQAKGLSVEGILAALQSGDLLALQEQLEAAQNEQAPEADESDMLDEE